MAKYVSDRCGCYPRGTPAGHKCPAKIIIVGEAPGNQERIQGVPFVGMSGRLLRDWHDAVGIKQSEVYYTNCYPFQPQHNDIKTIPKGELEKYARLMVDRISAICDSASIIVPTGGTALTALVGVHQITKWRGSILEAQLVGRKVKCIPTLHPAYALREPGIAKTCLADWNRIKGDSRFSELRSPHRNIVDRPSHGERESFYNHCRDNPGLPIALDIENDRSSIICISFAYSPDYGISVVFNSNRDFIRRVCELPNPKVAQTGLHDLYWLQSNEIKVCNFVYDTAALFHALDPNAGPTSTAKDADDPAGGRSRIKPFSLAYMGSIFTRQPFWKDEAKDNGEFIKVDGDATKLQRLMRYNALDSCATLEIYEKLKWHLENDEEKWWECLHEPCRKSKSTN